jgi:hypothetical protein
VHYWIGLTTENELHNKWAWIDNTPVSYSNFKEGIDDVRNKGHNCVSVIREEPNVKWTYRDCNIERNFVCENLVDEKVALLEIYKKQVEYCTYKQKISPSAIIIPLVLILIIVAIAIWICKYLGLCCFRKEKKPVEIEVVAEGDDDKEDPLKALDPSESSFEALATVDMPSAVNSRVCSDEDIYCKEMFEKYEVPVPCKFGPWPSDPPSCPLVPRVMDQIPKPEIELLTMVEDEEIV